MPQKGGERLRVLCRHARPNVACVPDIVAGERCCRHAPHEIAFEYAFLVDLAGRGGRAGVATP